jgi:hypothetical protein
VGEGQVLRWDGSTWSPFSSRCSYTKDYAVRGSGPDDVWVAGSEGRICHWDGSGFTTSEAWVSDEFHALWAFSPNDVWAVGCCSPVLHWDGVSWSRMPVGLMGSTASGVWGIAPDDLWVVGDIRRAEPDFGYAMLRYEGTSWNRVPVDGGWWYAVWGSSADDAWAVGINRFVGRWDGASWTTQELAGMGGTYRAVWGSSAGDVWIVGDEKTILHFRE